MIVVLAGGLAVIGRNGIECIGARERERLGTKKEQKQCHFDRGKAIKCCQGNCDGCALIRPRFGPSLTDRERGRQDL